MKKVLIAGATGYLGKYVVKEFRVKGYHVSAIARSESKLNDISEFVDEKIICELTDPSSLKNICDGVDVVFSSIGITKQKDGLTFMDVDYQANKNLLDEAIKAGVKKCIYTSVFDAEKMAHLKAIQAKLKFEEALKQSGLDYTIIYPNGFFSDMKEYLQMAEKGKGYVFGDGNNRINPIHGADLAEVCVDAVDQTEKRVEVGGPETLTHNQILKRAFEVVNKPVKISRVPVWLSNMVLWFARTFTSVKTYGGLEFFMTVLNLDMIAPQFGTHKLQDFFEKELSMK